MLFPCGAVESGLREGKVEFPVSGELALHSPRVFSLYSLDVLLMIPYFTWT